MKQENRAWGKNIRRRKLRRLCYKEESRPTQRGRGVGRVKWVKEVSCMVMGWKLNFVGVRCNVYRSQNILLYT